MKKLTLLLAILGLGAGCSALAQTPGQVTQGPGNTAGILWASNFGQWSVPQGNTGEFSWSAPYFCTATASGMPLKPVFNVGTPVYIKDHVPANSEIVVPSAVYTSNSSCSITVSPVHQHNTFTLTSATAGLQEAINYAAGLPYEVILTPDWSRLGGTTGMITAATGSAAVSIEDARSPCLVAYLWSGSAYVAQPNSCSGGGTGCPPSGGIAGYLLLDAGSGGCVDSLADYGVTTSETFTFPANFTVQAQPTDQSADINLNANKLASNLSSRPQVNVLATDTFDNQESIDLLANGWSCCELQNDNSELALLQGNASLNAGAFKNDAGPEVGDGNVTLTADNCTGGPTDPDHCDSDPSKNNGPDGAINLAATGPVSIDSSGIGLESQGNVVIDANSSQANAGNVNISSQSSAYSTHPGTMTGAVDIESVGPTVVSAANWSIDIGGNLTVTSCTGCSGSGGVSSLNSLTGALNITPGPGIAITPSGTSVEVTNTAPNIELAVTAFGALANAVYVDKGTAGNYYNTGDSYVTSYVGFTSADVGKYLVLQSGAHGGAWPPYPATQGEPGNVVKILSVSGNYATVDKASLTTGQANWFIGTDNVPAFNACATYATNLGGATCAVPPGNYLMVTSPYYVTSGVAQDDGGYESPAGGSGAVVTATVAGGGITGYTVTNGGSGYPHSAQMQMTFTGGCPAVYAGPCGGEFAIANTNSSGVVSTVTAVYNGYGLTTAPTVAVVPLGGDGATATCTLTGGTCGTPSIGAGGAGYVHSGTVNIFAVSNSCTYTGGIALGDEYYVEGQGTATTNSSGVVTSATWSTAPVGCSVAPAIVFGNVSCWNGGTSAFTSQCTNLAALLPAAMPVQVMMQPNVSWLGPGGAYSAGVELIGVWDYLTYDTPTPGSMLTEPAMFGGPLAFSDVTGIGIKQAFVGLFANNNANYSSVHDMTFTNDALGLLTSSMDNGFKIADLNFSSDGASLVNGGAWAHRTDYAEGAGGFSEPVSISNLHIISSGSNSAIDDWFAEEFWKPEFSANAVDFLEPCAFPQTPSQRQTSRNLANAINGANWGCYKGVVGFGWENLSRDDLSIPVGFPINSLYASGITRAMFYGVLGANTITGYQCESCPAMATDPYRASSLQEGLIEYVHSSATGTLTVNGLSYDENNAEPVNVYQDIYDILNVGFPYLASWQNLNSSHITHPLIPNNLDYQYATSLAPSTGGPDCLQIATTGLISNTGSPCGSGGGAVDSVNGQTGTVLTGFYPAANTHWIDNGDSRSRVSSSCMFGSGSASEFPTAISISSGVITFTQNNNEVAGNIHILQGFSAPYTGLNGQLVTVLSAGLSTTQWSASLQLAPVMTSNNAPSGLVTASSRYSYYFPWQVFNPTNGGWNAATNSNEYVQYQFPSKTQFSSYSITPWDFYGDLSNSPTNWIFEGSTDGVSWTTLDTETFSSWVANVAVNFPITPGLYTYYRLAISTNGGGPRIGLQQLGFYTAYSGTPSVTGVSNACRYTLPSQLKYSTLAQQAGVTVVDNTVSGDTAVNEATNYTTTMHPFTPAGGATTPVLFILHFDQDAASCENAATIFAAHKTLWQNLHADGAAFVDTTLTPYGPDAYCWADVTAAQTNVLLNEQGLYINSLGGLLVDVDGPVNNSADPNYYLQDSTDYHHPTDNWTNLVSNLIVNSIETGTNHIQSPPLLGATVASTANRSGSGVGAGTVLQDPNPTLGGYTSNYTGFFAGETLDSTSTYDTYSIFGMNNAGVGQNGVSLLPPSGGGLPWQFVMRGVNFSGGPSACFGFTGVGITSRPWLQWCPDQTRGANGLLSFDTDTPYNGLLTLLAHSFWLTGPAETVGTGQVSIGATVDAPGVNNCPAVGPTGCLVINVAGTPRDVPFY